MPIDYASLLNETQYEAVTTQEQFVRIIAGAGSGKTRVLTFRIAYLLDEMNVDPHDILAVTFTNKAAQEMKQRVMNLVPRKAPYLHVSTFHSFCARFLRKEIHQLGYPTTFSILDEEDVEKLVKDICVEKGHKRSDPFIKLALHYIDKHKTRGQYPDDIHPSEDKNQDARECHEVFARYEEEKEKMFVLDFDDLMLFTLRILDTFPVTREYYRNRFSHILIDEYQDTNDVQYELIKKLVSPMTSLYVVGDPDQTIYTWRGANQGIILDFPKDYDPCQDIVLARNYRSTKKILTAANSLISHNKKRVPKNLFTEENDGEDILFKRFDSAEDEARFVRKKIQDFAEKSGTNDYSNITVLYRASYLTRTLEAEFAASGIPYRIYGGLRFYQRREVKDVLAYFRLFVNPLDDVAFDRIINVPRRGIGDSSLKIIKREAEAVGLSEYEYCAHIQENPATELPKKVVVTLMDLTSRMEATKKELKENLEAYSAVLRRFIMGINYFAYIVEDQGIDEDRVGNVNALFDDINHFISDHPESSFEEYLQNIALLTAQDDINGGNYVSLMTVHVAKGLEFEHVFLIGLNEGVFPSYRAGEDNKGDKLEEERRLAYVAFTRAKQTLCLTTNGAYSYATDSHGTPSPFFEEAGLHFPAREYSYRSSWDRGGYKKRTFDDWTPDQDFDPFEEPKKPKEQKPSLPETNGITDWHLGDKVEHDKFGKGVVEEIIDASIIVVRFEDGSKKTLLSTHPMIHRARAAEA